MSMSPQTIAWMKSSMRAMRSSSPWRVIAIVTIDSEVARIASLVTSRPSEKVGILRITSEVLMVTIAGG